MPTGARYDGLADWYETFLDASPHPSPTGIALRLLDDGPGRLLDVGCGGGFHMSAFAEAGWSVEGVDISKDQLRLARARGLTVHLADAHGLPFPDGAFDAAVSIFAHTDLDDFPLALREVARVLRPGGVLAHVGVHPCFVGPHSWFPLAEETPILHPGYWDSSWRDTAPGIGPTGIRARVGARHLPLGLFMQAFLDASFALETVEEPAAPEREYPYILAIRARR